MTAVPVAALAVGAIVYWPRHPGQDSRRTATATGTGPGWSPLATVVVWELVNELGPGPSGDHPTLSSMLNAVDRHYGLKALVFLAWLGLGWTVVRLGRPAPR